MRGSYVQIFFALLFVTSLSFGQSLHGKYFLIPNMVGETQFELKFTNGSFTQMIRGDMGTMIGVGKYTIQGKKLLMEYLPVPYQDSSEYKIVYKKDLDSSSYGIVSATLFDEEDSPAVAMIGTNRKDGSSLSYFTTDKTGKAHSRIDKSEQIGFYSVNWLGYYRVMIPVSYLLGKETEITVKLKPTVLGYIYPKKVVYDLEFNSSKEFILTDAKKRKMIYKHAD